MTNTYYIPVYEWGKNPESIHGSSHGCYMYDDLTHLYMMELEAVGHFEVMGSIPTENEFKEKHGLKSGAV